MLAKLPGPDDAADPNVGKPKSSGGHLYDGAKIKWEKKTNKIFM